MPNSKDMSRVGPLPTFESFVAESKTTFEEYDKQLSDIVNRWCKAYAYVSGKAKVTIDFGGDWFMGACEEVGETEYEYEQAMKFAKRDLTKEEYKKLEQTHQLRR